MQPPRWTAQRKVFLPCPRPLTHTVLWLLLLRIPLPVVTVQLPDSATAADSWAEVLQVSKSLPAFRLKLPFTKVTWLLAEHPFFTTVHVKTLFPPLRPLTGLVARLDTETVALPPLTLQLPLPWAGLAAPSVELLPQTVWPAPAEELTESLRTRVVELLLQIPLLTVHTSWFSPRPRPVRLLVAELGVTTVAEPVSTVQEPVPWSGDVAFSTALPLQVDTVLPASADTLLFTTTRFELWLQLLFLTVHVKMLVPVLRPLTDVLATPGWETVPVRLLQRPVPTTGSVAPSWALLLQTSKLEDTWALEGLSFTMFTRALAVQPFLEAVHWNVLRPSCRFVTPLFDWLAEVTDADPVARLQLPDSPGFCTAPRVAVVPHTLWSAPALVTKLLLFTATVLVLLHWPWTTVQLNRLAPEDRPDTALTALLGDCRMLEPTVLQLPLPCAGTDASRVAVVPQTVWPEPAHDCTWLLVNDTSALLEHWPRVTVQRKLFTPRPRPETVLCPLLAEARTALPPFRTVHTPVPTAGFTPLSVPWPSQLAPDGPPSAWMLLLVTRMSELLLQPPWTTVHVKRLVPEGIPLTEVAAALGAVMEEVPEVDQLPVPIDGTTAFRFALLLHTLKSLPALGDEGVMLVTLT